MLPPIQNLLRKRNASRLYRRTGAEDTCQLEMWTNSTVRPAGTATCNKKIRARRKILMHMDLRSKSASLLSLFRRLA